MPVRCRARTNCHCPASPCLPPRIALEPAPFAERPMIQAIGIDFGTTNSVVALLHD